MISCHKCKQEQTVRTWGAEASAWHWILPRQWLVSALLDVMEDKLETSCDCWFQWKSSSLTMTFSLFKAHSSTKIIWKWDKICYQDLACCCSGNFEMLWYERIQMYDSVKIWKLLKLNASAAACTQCTKCWSCPLSTLGTDQTFQIKVHWMSEKKCLIFFLSNSIWMTLSPLT